MNPLSLKAEVVLATAAAALIVALSLAAWALWERSGRMAAKADLAKAEAVVEGMTERVNTQNTAVEGWKSAAVYASRESQRLTAEAEAKARQHDAEVARLSKLAGQSNKDKGCSDAIREIFAQ